MHRTFPPIPMQTIVRKGKTYFIHSHACKVGGQANLSTTFACTLCESTTTTSNAETNQTHGQSSYARQTASRSPSSLSSSENSKSLSPFIISCKLCVYIHCMHYNRKTTSMTATLSVEAGIVPSSLAILKFEPSSVSSFPLIPFTTLLDRASFCNTTFHGVSS